MRNQRAFGWWVCVVVVGACGGPPATPIGPSTNPQAGTVSCPVLDATIPAAACVVGNEFIGVRLNNSTLVCGSGATVPFTKSTVAGGASRYAVAFTTGTTVLTTTATPVDARCFDGISVNIGITMAFTYTGDEGTEMVAGVEKRCITRSRVDWTTFRTSDPLVVHPGVESLVKDKIHNIIDAELLKSLYATTWIGRCTRWKAL